MKSTTRFNYDFIKSFKIFGGLSFLLIAASLAIIFTKGFNYGIDFAGGTEMQVRFSQLVDVVQVRSFVEGLGLEKAQVQRFDENNEFLIRFESPERATAKETNEAIREIVAKFTTGLDSTFPDANPEIRRVDSVGPQVGSQLKRNSLLATFYSLLVILLYIGLRFDYKYAPGAVISLFHDAILTLAVLVLLGREMNVQILAAILTLIGYSLNDTIVTYDRIRENEDTMKGQDAAVIINRSINETLGRTILTTFSTFLAVGALYAFAGGVISDFAFTMGVGMLFGVYSTIFVAAQTILFYERIVEKKSV